MRDFFSANDNRRVVTTVGEIKKAYRKEYEAQAAELFEETKKDIIAQLMATCMVELNKEFGFGKKRLNRFKRGTEWLFVQMMNDGLMGMPFTTQNCIDFMRDKYGIDVEAKEAK